MIAITFALPDESSDFLRAIGCPPLRGSGAGAHALGHVSGVEIGVWHVGMGPACAEKETAKMLAEWKPAAVICAGFGGGLQPGLTAGDLVLDAAEWEAAGSSAEAALPSARPGAIYTLPLPAEGSEEKMQLGRETGALACDMETAAVRRLCRAGAVPLLALRAISDPVEEALPIPLAAWFDMERQGPRIGGLLGHLALHPGAIFPFVRFVRNLAPCRRALATALCALIPAVAKEIARLPSATPAR